MRRKHGKILSSALVTALTITNIGGLMPMTALASDAKLITYSAGTTKFTLAGDYDEELSITDMTTKLPAPSVVFSDYEAKAGYTFYWNDNTTGDLEPGEATYDDVTVDGDKKATIVPNIAADEFKVKFAGVTPTIEAKDKTFETDLGVIADPTKDHATFTGWDITGDTEVDIAKGASAKVQSEKIDAQYLVNKGDVTMTALWDEAAEYTITYDANGATVKTAIEPQTYYADDTKVTLADPAGKFEYDDHTFKGWSTEKTRTAKAFNETTNPKTDFETLTNNEKFAAAKLGTTTLYAIWEENESYTVSFDADGGEGTIDDMTAKDGKTIKLPNNTFTLTGSHLVKDKEWKSGSTEYKNGAEVGPYSVNTTTTFVSNWVENNYTVKFDTNGATGTKPADQAVDYSVDVTFPTKGDLKNGKSEFLGWALKANATDADYEAGEKVSGLSEEDGDILTYYAVWADVEDAYNITYDVNGGKGTIAPVKGTSLPYETNNGAAFSRENYTLLGWSTDKDATEAQYKVTGATPDSIVTSATTNITLYAIWLGDPHTVDFDPNGGTGSMATQKFVYGTAQKLTKNSFTYTGHNFKYWANQADPDDTAVIYQNEEEIDDLAANTVLYAIWEGVDEKATAAAKDAADAANKAAEAADTKAAAAKDAADAANKAAEAAKSNPTDATVAEAKKAAEAATKAADEATAAATAAENAAKTAEEKAKVAGVDADVKAAAEAAAQKATKSASDAKTQAAAATTAAKAATDAASGVVPKAADGSAKDTPAAEGTELVDANGNKTGFKVTDASASNPEVEFEGPADKNATKADIPETYTDLSGNTYKVTGIVANAFKDTKVKTVTIRKNIKKIDPNAFKKSKVKNVKIKSVKLTKKMTKAFKKLKKGGKITVSGKHKAKNKELLNNLSNVKNGKTKVK